MSSCFYSAVAPTSLSPAPCTTPPFFVPQLSAPHVASPTHPSLHCAVVRSQSWGLQQIILPTESPSQLRAAETRKPISASESAEHMPFRKNPEGLAAITHLANATGRGFILWATLDRIISLYSVQAFHIVKGQPPPALLIY